jgi:hypothetical protein
MIHLIDKSRKNIPGEANPAGLTPALASIRVLGDAVLFCNDYLPKSVIPAIQAESAH